MLTSLGKVVKTNYMLENKIISAALSGHNFFVLVQAGTNKSTVIEENISYADEPGKGGEEKLYGKNVC